MKLVKGLSTAWEVARAEIKKASPKEAVRQVSQICGVSGRRPGDGFYTAGGEGQEAGITLTWTVPCGRGGV